MNSIEPSDLRLPFDAKGPYVVREFSYFGKIWFMKTLYALAVLLVSATAGYGQYVDSLLCKFSRMTHLYNTNLSDGEDLYLTFSNPHTKRIPFDCSTNQSQTVKS